MGLPEHHHRGHGGDDADDDGGGNGADDGVDGGGDGGPDKDLYIEQAGPTAISSRGAFQWSVVARWCIFTHLTMFLISIVNMMMRY